MVCNIPIFERLGGEKMLRILELEDGTFSIELTIEKSGLKTSFKGQFVETESEAKPKENGLRIEVETK